MAKKGYFPSIRTRHGSVTITLDSSRFERQFDEAQQYLGNQVLTDCTPLVPMQQGMLRDSGRVLDGGREVVWDGPYAHYQYNGMVMAGKAHKHYTGDALTYHTAGTGSFWFENAKSANLEAWIGEVKRIAGGG